MAEKIEKIYKLKKADYQTQLTRAQKQDNKIVLYRSLLAIITVGLLIYGYLHGWKYLYLYLIPPVVLFMVMVNQHSRIRDKIVYLKNLVCINEEGLLRLSGEWTGFADSGAEFSDPEHPYTADLNIFGRGSLYQYLNATNLATGEQALVDLLSKKSGDQEIKAAQGAVKDLASRLDWRQRFQARGRGGGYKKEDLLKLCTWAKESPGLLQKKYIYLLWLLPVTTVVLLIMMLHRLIPPHVPLMLLILQVLLVTAGQPVTAGVFKDAETVSGELKRLMLLLNLIEQESFQAPRLVQLQSKLLKKNQTVSRQVQDLSRIAVLINLRYSIVYHFINALVFCDLFTIKTLNQWKSQYGWYLEQWLRVIGQFEALSSLAGLAHDYPEWVFPEVKSEGASFIATDLGHPLIREEFRVSNNVSLPHAGTVHIITGSNMSGKSTLLRTVGINLVLAYAGAPVCAGSMSCSLMDIFTSMGIQDSLEQRISAFYAELKRIKIVVDATYRGNPLIFLLDEIFKGTNSRDRITGARAVIKNLARQSSIGLVTTHDLELSLLANESPHIKNYHFTDKIINDKLTFDYLLKEGVSKTTNAIALIKMAGIDIDGKI